jgi:site-specific DNA recombinase
MTAAWSKGCRRHYPYYLCDTPGCSSRRKSIPRARIDEGFETILQNMQPTEGLFAVAKAMFIDAWEARRAEAQGAKDAVIRQVKEVEKQIEGLLDRLIEAASPSVVKAYESRIEKLEREKLVLAERASRTLPEKGRLEEFIELSLTFLANHWNIWNNGPPALRQAVLRLAFL